MTKLPRQKKGPKNQNSWRVKYRPKNFDEIVGNDETKQKIQAILKRKDEIPKVIIFHGKYGNGLSSFERMFTKSLICEKNDITQCKGCRYEVDAEEDKTQGLYCSCENVRLWELQSEYDIYDFRRVYEKNFILPLKVLAYCNIELLSQKALAYLKSRLTSREIAPEHIILCTNDYEALPSELIAASVSFKIARLSEEEIIGHLRILAQKENVFSRDESDEQKEHVLAWIGKNADGKIQSAMRKLWEYHCTGKLEDEKSYQTVTQLLESLLRGRIDSGHYYSMIVQLLEQGIDIKRALIGSIAKHLKEEAEDAYRFLPLIDMVEQSSYLDSTRIDEAVVAATSIANKMKEIK